MTSKSKYRIIERPNFLDKNSTIEKRFTQHLYGSKSFLIRYYAFLPLIHSIKYITFSENSRILDIGCSDGPFLPTLNYYAKSIIANDILEDRVREAKNLIDFSLNKSKKVNLICSDGQYLPFKENNFDFIFCLEVLEHITRPDHFLRELFRVLKKNGTLICTLPIETGLSLLIRNFIGKIANFPRPKYKLKQYFQRVLLKKGGREYKGEVGHKNFDWREIKNNIKLHFKIIKMKFIPINYLKDVNPIVLIKAVKVK
jgi:2-polyprenyl-3-methyl-5-hydroxy-6-metoxy-1,4-benzoquinol methylase